MTSRVGRRALCVPGLCCDPVGQGARGPSASSPGQAHALAMRSRRLSLECADGTRSRRFQDSPYSLLEVVSEGVQETSAPRAVLSTTRIAEVTSGGLQPALGRADDRVAAAGAGQREDRNVVACGEDELDGQHADEIFIEGLTVEHNRPMEPPRVLRSLWCALCFASSYSTSAAPAGDSATTPASRSPPPNPPNTEPANLTNADRNPRRDATSR